MHAYMHGYTLANLPSYMYTYTHMYLCESLSCLGLSPLYLRLSLSLSPSPRASPLFFSLQAIVSSNVWAIQPQDY